MQFSAALDTKEIEKVFRNLPRTTQRRALMPSLRVAAFVIRDIAVSNIKSVTSGEGTGVLEKNIRVYNYKKFKGNYRVAVQVKRGLMNTKVRGKPVRVGLYAGVLEYREGGRYSWIRKAIREGKYKTVSTLGDEVKKRMSEAIADAKQ